MHSLPSPQFLKHLYGRLHDPPLDVMKPDDRELYVPLYESGEDLSLPEIDPVSRLLRRIQLSQEQSIQFFSGFRGAGKSTELFRLRQVLSRENYIVIYANALNYINETGVLDISDLLILVAGAFSDGLKDRAVLGREVKQLPFWDRLVNYLKRIKFSFGEVSISAGLELKASLKNSPSFRQRMQAALSPHIASLKSEVDEFIEASLTEIRSYQPDATKEVVFLFDSLEQIRGTVSLENDVQRSVETVFGSHVDKLSLPGLHMVYTVPPWLRFLGTSRVPMVILPSIKQWNRDGSPYESGNEALRQILLKRLEDSGVGQLLGGDIRQVDPLINNCGGHVRDLLHLLRQVLLAVKQIPVSEQVVTRAVEEVRWEYSAGLALDDAEWLDKIARFRAADHRLGDIGRLSRFLDTHTVLYFVDDCEWYDVHPLVRHEVAKMLERNPSVDQTTE